jgi:tRNA guanosine-2'-O-methyltransferase
MVVGVTQDHDNDKDWYLRTLFSFLENNSEMKRLRTKQQKFFDGYDCDTACTSEGLMSISVDESDEANPLHLVDAIKNCLEEIYLEAHEEDAPVWKQIEEMTIEQKIDHLQKEGDGNVNFQRKIIPLDSLGLALEESRDKQLRNASGRKRQQLIICASLIDKVPNLAGLARTAEIFAAERLVVPDISVCKMDNFKSISVGAGEWIKIEECKEDVSECSSLQSFLPMINVIFNQDLF